METPEQSVSRLRKKIENGRLDLRCDLVAALSDWASLLSEEKRHEESIQRYNELIALCRELLEEGQIEYRTPLARAQIYRLLESAETQPASAVVAEFRRAIAFLESSLAEGQEQYRENLAETYMYLSDFLRTKHLSPSAALAHTDRALETWRTLIDEGEAEWRPVYAAALVSKGSLLREIGDGDAAIAAFKESEEIQKTLLEEEVPEAAVELLRCYTFQAETYSHFQQFAQAHQLFDQTIAYCQELARSQPKDVYGWLPLLLVDKAKVYREEWQFADALNLYQQAVREFEKQRHPALANMPLAVSFLGPQANWDDYTDLRIAHICSNCGCLLHDLEQYGEALKAFDDAIKHYEQVEARGVAEMQVDKCLVRLNRAKALLDARQEQEAVEIQQEAVKRLQEWIDQGKTALRVNLAQAFRELGVALYRTGQNEPALELFGQSIDLWRKLLDEGHLEKREQLAYSLLVRSDYFLEKKQFDQALGGYLECARICIELLEEERNSLRLQALGVNLQDRLLGLGIPYTTSE